MSDVAGTRATARVEVEAYQNRTLDLRSAAHRAHEAALRGDLASVKAILSVALTDDDRARDRMFRELRS